VSCRVASGIARAASPMICRWRTIQLWINSSASKLARLREAYRSM
jgi:hypothetical protein